MKKLLILAAVIAIGGFFYATTTTQAQVGGAQCDAIINACDHCRASAPDALPEDPCSHVCDLAAFCS